jgi:small multidrug resistance family-3 protein
VNLLAWFIFVVAAVLEVGGDAVIRRGIRGHSALTIGLGCATLAAYGVLVNSLRWDFSRLLGVYVGFFALASVLFGRFAFHEPIPASTWSGLALILTGCLVIQFGRT